MRKFSYVLLSAVVVIAVMGCSSAPTKEKLGQDELAAEIAKQKTGSNHE